MELVEQKFLSEMLGLRYKDVAKLYNSHNYYSKEATNATTQMYFSGYSENYGELKFDYQPIGKSYNDMVYFEGFKE